MTAGAVGRRVEGASLYNPKRPVLLLLLVVAGFVLLPAWYIWVGLRLRSTREPAEARVRRVA